MTKALEIPTALGSWTENRNGLRDIISLYVWDSRGQVFIECHGKSGKLLRGGICINEKAMDNLCEQWLKARESGRD